MTPRFFKPTVALFALLAVACGGTSPDGSTTPIVIERDADAVDPASAHADGSPVATQVLGTDANLAGGAWTLDGEVSLTLRDGRINGRLACNTISGTYVVNGEVIDFSIITTLVACELSADARRLQDMFTAGRAFRLDGDVLTLIADDGAEVQLARSMSDVVTEVVSE